jgi:hypothetical protein
LRGYALRVVAIQHPVVHRALQFSDPTDCSSVLVTDTDLERSIVPSRLCFNFATQFDQRVSDKRVKLLRIAINLRKLEMTSKNQEELDVIFRAVIRMSNPDIPLAICTRTQ